MNNDEIRKDEIKKKTPVKEETPEELIKNISELIEDRFSGIKEEKNKGKNKPEPESAPKPDVPPVDEKDVVEADPMEQMTRDQVEFMRRKELVGNQVEMYDETIPYEQGLPPKEKSVNLRNELFSWAESVTIAVLIICLLFAFAVRTIGVKGPSMQSTFFNGDRVVVSHLGMGEPRYGDIVIISKKSFREDSIIKRVIATGGQTIDIDFATGDVRVDGELLDEPYINERTYLKYDIDFPVRVPEGYVFVMGDNRNNSDDSRDSDLGMVSEQEIVGRVLFRFWPLSELDVFKRF